jgi:hypothetical protein
LQHGVHNEQQSSIVSSAQDSVPSFAFDIRGRSADPMRIRERFFGRHWLHLMAGDLVNIRVVPVEYRRPPRTL